MNPPTSRGWQVTGLARAEDETFVRGLGADFTAEPRDEWDATERDITIDAVTSRADGSLLAQLLDRVTDGTIPARIHATLPLAEVVSADQMLTEGGVRGRIVLLP